ncbi:MAG: septal ring lytic transglycosylase RlpA family protein [Terriglobales bacterium]
MRRLFAHGLVSILAVVSIGAAPGSKGSESKDTEVTLHKPAAPTVKAVSPVKPKPHPPYQVGTASWYGEYFEGRATASGEPFHMYELTAAHPTLPLGTWVRVTNLSNGRRIFVRINDRGPIVPGRIIDLSYSAAQALAFQEKGLQQVRLDLASARDAQPKQIAMFQPVAY